MRFLRAAWTIFWKVLLFFILFGLLLAAPIVPMGGPLRTWSGLHPLWAMFYTNTVGLVTIVAATWLMMRFIEKAPLREIGTGASSLTRRALWGTCAGTLWLGVSLGAACLGGWVTRVSEADVSALILLGSGVSILFNVITQQFLLNGYIFRTLRMNANTATAVIVSALLFSSYHFGAFKGHWLPALNVFLAGVLFCLTYVLFENLWFTTAMHFAWDYLMGTVLGLDVSGTASLGGGWRLLELHGPEWAVGSSFGLEGGLIVTVTALCGIVIAGFALRRKRPAAVPGT